MRKTAYLLVAAVLVCAAPAFAQGPFNDVPTDHWAYDAVNQLQKDGVVIGYPDGTYGGKRAMSRYEFAVAIARLPIKDIVDLSPYAKKDDLKDFVKRDELPKIPDLSQLATKADVDALRRLIDEFRDELAALGVDVDALKRDVAALGARVDAIEEEQRRVRFEGDVNVFAISTSADQGTAFDLDNRFTQSFNTNSNPPRNTIIRNIGVVRDFDLKITGRVSDTVTAYATINYGNYLNYVGYIDDYVGGVRPTRKDEPSGPAEFTDGFFPYYLYIDWALGSSLRVGRFPMQFTPYTLKKIDVDAYTSILKTDDGNYPVDGINLAYDFGGVDLTLFAVKHDQNAYLLNGLTGQPNAGPYNIIGRSFVTDQFGVFQGNAVGGLGELITQSAGARVVVGTPWRGNIGLTYYQAWSKDAWEGGAAHDQARVYGADLNVPFGSNVSLIGSWTQSDTLASDRGPAGTLDIDNDNTAWDAKLNFGLGRLGIGAGYKHIEHNFAAAGAWDKIGRWANPTNMKGPYADLSYPIGRRLKFVADAEFLQTVNTAVFGGLDIDVTKAEGGLKWGMSRANSLDLGYEWVRYDPSVIILGRSDFTETYLTVGWAHQMSPNAGFKVAYQFINFTGVHPGFAIPAVEDQRGGLGVVEFGVSF